MTHEHFTTDDLIDYLHGELEPQCDAAFMRDLDTCPQCQAEFEREAALTDALHGYAELTQRDLPPGVVATIWDRVDKESARASSGWSAWWRPLVALPVAAGLVFLVLFGFSAGSHGATSIAAAYYLDDHEALVNTIPFSEGSVVPSSLLDDQTGSDQQWIASTGASDVAANEAR